MMENIYCSITNAETTESTTEHKSSKTTNRWAKNGSKIENSSKIIQQSPGYKYYLLIDEPLSLE